MQNRFKSPVAWSAVSAMVLFIMKTTGLLDQIGLTEEGYKQFIDVLFGVLVTFGIFNNPTEKEKF